MNVFGITFENFIVTPGHEITGYEADLIMDGRKIAHCSDRGDLEPTKVSGLSIEDEKEFRKRMPCFFKKYPPYIAKSYMKSKAFQPESIAFLNKVDFMVDCLANFVQYEVDYYDASEHGAKVIVIPMLPMFSKEPRRFDPFSGFTSWDLAKQYIEFVKPHYDEVYFWTFQSPDDFILK